MELPLFFLQAETHYGVWIALITSVAGVVSIFISQYFSFKNSEKIIEKEREIERKDLLIENLNKEIESVRSNSHQSHRELTTQVSSLVKFLSMWNEVGTMLSRLWKETSTTRFLVLQAWNGAENPRRTTAILEYRGKEVVQTDFDGFKLDGHYVNLLQRLKVEDEIELVVSELGDCRIGEVYRAEDPPITHSRWKMIATEKIDDTHSTITYCSFANNENRHFTEKEKVRQNALVNQIQLKIESDD